MQAFEIKTNKSDYPFLIIANGFKRAIEVLYQKGIYDTDIVSVQQLEAYKSDHILIEERLTSKEVLREEVRRELQKDMPRWMPEPNGAAGGADRDIYLVRTSKGHYFTASCIGGNNHYLVLDALEQLPGLPKQD
jgi:predicted aspartyl protease